MYLTTNDEGVANWWKVFRFQNRIVIAFILLLKSGNRILTAANTTQCYFSASVATKQSFKSSETFHRFKPDFVLWNLKFTVDEQSPRTSKLMGVCDTFPCVANGGRFQKSSVRHISESICVWALRVCDCVCYPSVPSLSFQHCTPWVMSWTKKKE